MKKTYSKPEIFFENFSLSQNIAGDCEEKTNTPSQGQCGLDFGPFVVFLDSVGSVCTGAGRVEDMGGDGAYGQICYHVPYGENLFNS